MSLPSWFYVDESKGTTRATHTFTYKQASGLDLPLDVLVPQSDKAKIAIQQAHNRLPICFWIHGGGGVQGSRTERYQHLVNACNNQPCILVCPDYRLCPQVRFSDLLEDLVDAMKWTVHSLPSHLARLHPRGPVPDTHQIILQGYSIGGYLSLALGMGVAPTLRIGDGAAAEILGRIVGICALYPVVNIDVDFWATPSPAFQGFGTLSADLASKVEEAMKRYADPSGPVISSTKPEGPPTDAVYARNWMYPWSQTQGNLYALLFGPDREEQKTWVTQANLLAFIPQHAEAIRAAVGRDTARGGPPGVYVLHGDADAAVPVEQARLVVAALRAAGFATAYEELPGEDHMFDRRNDVSLAGMYAWQKGLLVAPGGQPQEEEEEEEEEEEQPGAAPEIMPAQVEVEVEA